MASPREVEVHDEVREWFVALHERPQDQVAKVIDQLGERGEQLRMPHSRALGDGLFELRINLRDEQRRIMYRFARDGRIVLLTTFQNSARTNVARSLGRG